MSPAAVALQFPALDSADAEWGEECEEVVMGAAASPARRLQALKNGLRIGQPDGAPTSLDALKAEVAMVVAGGRAAGPAWPTGVAELDAALGGGVPRGRVTEVVGPLGAGKTSLVRHLVARVLADGGWVAWVDATRTLAPQDLAGLGERLIMVRPHDHTRGAWCADLLLRGGVFALVVLDGAPVLSRTVGVRLSQLARERDAAFVVLREGTQGSRLGGAVRLQVRPVQTAPVKHTKPMPTKSAHTNPLSIHTVSINGLANDELANKGLANKGMANKPLPTHAAHNNALPNKPPSVQHTSQWRERRTPDRMFSVLVEKGGSYKTVEVTCAIVVARRVCADTEIPDRRGVARGARAAGGVEQKSAQDSRASIERGAVSAHESVHPIAAVAPEPAITYGHTVDASTVRKPGDDPAWKKGRGRPRMAESSYGRTTRRGKARQLLSNREHAQSSDGYQRKQRVAEPNAHEHTLEHAHKHTEQPNRQQERRESRRQSRLALNGYAGSGHVGTLG
ncbi:MAG: hypothetical protein ABI120_04920 [Gemmatimonadaceae bacterium]